VADVRVKICGLRDAAMVEAAARAGAAYVGFMFFAKSPRNVSFAQAHELAVRVPMGIAKVAVLVDPDDPTLEALLAQVPIDMLQLHGHESPERVRDVKARFGLPVMKVVGVADAADLPIIDLFGQVADQILVETKAPQDALLPGGNGQPFDWRLIAGRRWPVPWMLAGGLTVANVAEAIRLTGARQVDVSSGVESSRGVKDAGLIAEFIAAAGGN
jgi:phosphoribosylanthranilate isomerase